jgi:hypothetical protein
MWCVVILSSADCNGAGFRLADLVQYCKWLNLETESGMWQLVRGCHISYQHAQEHIHSPDPQYQAKLEVIQTLWERVQQSEGMEVLLYLDELTYYRQPTLSWTYEQAGPSQPHAERSLCSNTATRLVGTLDASTGQVLVQSGSKVGVKELVGFYQQVRAAYPEAQRIWIVQDNWPVHFHPDVLVALEPQQTPFAFPRPKDWADQPSPTAIKRWADLRLPIQFVPLPTYASWCNPIEKLWRKLKQDILHLHRQADDLPTLRARVLAFLHQFASGSTDLLHYVGLSDNAVFNF